MGTESRPCRCKSSLRPLILPQHAASHRNAINYNEFVISCICFYVLHDLLTTPLSLPRTRPMPPKKNVSRCYVRWYRARDLLSEARSRAVARLPWTGGFTSLLCDQRVHRLTQCVDRYSIPRLNLRGRSGVRSIALSRQSTHIPRHTAPDLVWTLSFLS